MSKKQGAAYPFNGNRSAIKLAWSPINQAWLVWRQDGDDQGLLRIHNDYDEAVLDFQDRVTFVQAMEASTAAG